MLALDDHNAQALFAFVDAKLAFGRKPEELLALEYLGEFPDISSYVGDICSIPGKIPSI